MIVPLLTLVCCAGIPGTAAAQKLTFSILEHDMGTIKEGGPAATVAFPFTNTGDKPLVITDAATSCKCTKAVVPNKPVLPGKSAVIEVMYDPRNQSGTFFKAIQVFSNDPARRAIVTLRGEVVE